MSMAAAEEPVWVKKCVTFCIWCLVKLSHTRQGKETLTNEAKNVPDSGDEDDQGVGAGQQHDGDDGVADPAEVLRGTQELVDGGTNLRRKRQREVTRHEWLNVCGSNNPRLALRLWHLQGKAPRGRWGSRRSARPAGRSAGSHRTCKPWSRCVTARAPHALYGRTAETVETRGSSTCKWYFYWTYSLSAKLVLSRSCLVLYFQRNSTIYMYIF